MTIFWAVQDLCGGMFVDDRPSELEAHQRSVHIWLNRSLIFDHPPVQTVLDDINHDCHKVTLLGFTNE
jgi:hypothetical protein